MNLNLYEPLFSRAEVADIADLPASTLRGWIQRGVVDVTPFHKGGTGNNRLYSPFDIVRIAVIAQLNQFGVAPSIANELIVSDEFKQWFEAANEPTPPNEDVPVHLLVFMKGSEGGYVANCIRGKSEWDLILDEHGWFTTGAKSYFTVRFGEIISHTVNWCRHLMMLRADPASLSDRERNLLELGKSTYKRTAPDGGDDA